MPSLPLDPPTDNRSDGGKKAYEMFCSIIAPGQICTPWEKLGDAVKFMWGCYYVGMTNFFIRSLTVVPAVAKPGDWHAFFE